MACLVPVFPTLLLDPMYIATRKQAAESFAQTRIADYDMDTLPDYLKEAAEFKQLTVYLLNLRHNIMSGLVVAKLSRLDKAKNRLFELLRQGRTVFPWRPDIKEYAANAGLLKKIMFYIEEANSTRVFLCQNQETSLDAKYTDRVYMKVHVLLKKAISKMKIDEVLEDTIQTAQPNQPELVASFIKSINNFK